MSDPNFKVQENNLKAILKIVLKKTGEEILFRGMKAALGLLFQSGLQLAFGNFFAITIPIPELVTYLSKTGYHAYRQVERDVSEQTFGAQYTITTPETGLVVAKAKNVLAIKQFPILLPTSAQYATRELILPKNSLSELTFQEISPRTVFQALTNTYAEDERFLCSDCANFISVSRGKQLGHAPYCIKNPKRYIEWCDECESNLTKTSHKPGCRRAILSR